MLYRRKEIQDDICLLEISLDILNKKEFIFTDGNAASHSTCFYNKLDDLDILPWDVLNNGYWSDYEDGRRKKCAEFLIYPRIDSKYIKRIHCKTIDTEQLISSYFKSVSYSPNLFF